MAAKYPGATDLKRRKGARVPFTVSLIRCVNRIGGLPAVHGHGRSDGDRNYTVDGFQAFEHCLLHVNDALRFFHFLIRNTDADGLNTAGIAEAGIHLTQVVESANHQTGGDEEDQGESYLKDDQPVLDLTAIFAVTQGSPATAKRIGKPRAQVPENGNQARREY